MSFTVVTIARAIAQDTPILLLDEPTAHLDIRHQIEVFDLLSNFRSFRRKTVVCVTHDLNLAAMYCDRVWLMSEGRLLADDIPQQVLTGDLVEQTYQTRVGRFEDGGRPLLFPRRGDDSDRRFPPPEGPAFP